MKKVLIDTNIYSLAMKGDVEVVNTLRNIDRIGFSTISIGELLFGFRAGKYETKNREELGLFLIPPGSWFIPLMRRAPNSMRRY